MKKGTFIKKLLTSALLCTASYLQGQAPLGLQGALQKPSGEPFGNGDYSIVFSLYDMETGGTALWSETQPAVRVINGLYNVLLGSRTPLTVPFSKTYYLGVSVDGGDELAPRARLGAAPYSVSVIGQANIFPSDGSVGVGTISPDTSALLHLKNSQGNTTLLIEGQQSAELLLEKAGSTSALTFDGRLDITNLNLTIDGNLDFPPGGSILYNGLSDWRLVDRDDFSTDQDSWSCVDNWWANDPKSVQRISPNTPFSKSFILRPTQHGNDVLKKRFDLSGIPHTMVKVVFTYHFLDTWDNEIGFAAFGAQDIPFTSTGQENGLFQIGWLHEAPPGIHFDRVGYFKCELDAYDAGVQGEMVAPHSGDSFWLFFGSNLDQLACDESYAIGNIEIWVR